MTKSEKYDIKYSLNNQDNYKNNLINNLQEIADNYIYILLNYILLFNEKINNNRNNSKNIIFFILKKGISTINYIFLFILYYTKNLELTFYHLQNSYIFYIEFIEQINFNSSNSIKISVNDAVTFVYKKNIYNINNSINNISEEEKKIFFQIQEIIKMFTEIIDMYISNIPENEFNLIELKNIIEILQNSVNQKIKIKNKNIINFNIDIINSIQHFTNLLNIFNISFLKKKELLFSFINEINSKKNINFNLLTNNIQSFDFGIIDENINSSEIISTMFSH